MSLASITLADECELITKGTTPSTLGLKHQERGIPFIRAQNLVNGTVSIDADPLYIDEKTHELLKRSKIKPTDILLSIAGTIGRAAMVPATAEEMNCNQAVAIIRPSSRIDRGFLLHWLSSGDAVRQVTKGKVTGTISNLSLGEIGKLKVPLPSLDEQRRIAAILGKADALRFKRKREIELLESLSNAIFFEMFESEESIGSMYPRAPLEKFVRVMGGYAFKSEHFSIVGAPIVRISNLDGKFVRLNDAVRIPEGKIGKAKEFVVKPDDLLIAMSGATTGKTGIVPSDASGLVYLNQRVGRFCIIDAKQVLPAYLVGLVRSKAYQKHVQEFAWGAAQPNISSAQLVSFEFSLPPVAKQLRFSETIHRLEKLMMTSCEGLSKMDSLFISLLSRAFSGQL